MTHQEVLPGWAGAMADSVDLPAPFSPSSATASPPDTARLTPCSTGLPENALPIPARDNRAEGCAGRPSPASAPSMLTDVAG